MTISSDLQRIARDPLWFPHRYDPGHDAVHFLQLERSVHRAATFITDEYLPANATRAILRRSDVVAASGGEAPLHFIFHSAYCCSTMLARAFDCEQVAMGLKEPVILNDIIGWKHRGATAPDIDAVLADALHLLARPFSAGEAVIVKPSNVINALAPRILALKPRAAAVMLYAPLKTYLGSIARKGMWGRLWMRELFVKQLGDGLLDFGFATSDYLGQTDLQIAALGWLAQHALFVRLAIEHGPQRVRTLDSETLVARPAEVMRALGELFGLSLDAEAIAAGPAFTSHSKTRGAFSAAARADERKMVGALDAGEIDKVAVWAAAVADARGVPMIAPSPLLR